MVPKHIKPRPELIVSGDVFMEVVVDGRARNSLSISEAVDGVFLPRRIFYAYLLRFQLLSACNIHLVLKKMHEQNFMYSYCYLIM